MKNVVSLALGASLLFGISAEFSRAYAVESLSTPTGLHQWNQSEAFNGYTLVTPNLSNNVYLIDMEGNVVHKWETAGKPGLYAELLPNGNLLRGIRFDPKPVPFGGVSGAVQEIDWDGKVVWEKKIFSPTNVTHHAFDRMPNGNTLIICWGYKTYDEAMAKGRTPGTLPKKGEGEGDGIAYDGLWEDYIVEVDPTGKEVWAWHSWDHIGKGKDQLDLNYRLPIDNYYGDSDWLHLNSVRYIPETNQLLITSRNFGEVYLIDKATGKMSYRWGNPTTHNADAVKPSFTRDGDQLIFGPHDSTWLGDGKVLLFDNGWQRPEVNRSRALILDTKTNKIEWEYAAKNPNSFYTAYQGSAQKLPNGNVMITSTHTGHIFEVTPDAKPRVVWEYVSPWTHKGPVALLTDDYSLGGSDINIMGNFVHRAFRYSKDYPGLKGRDLSKKQVLFPGAPDWRKLYEEAQALKAAF